MNIVEKAIKRMGGQRKLADALNELTGLTYKPGHVHYWKTTGYFPARIAGIVASRIFDGEITIMEACPKIKIAA